MSTKNTALQCRLKSEREIAHEKYSKSGEMSLYWLGYLDALQKINLFLMGMK